MRKSGNRSNFNYFLVFAFATFLLIQFQNCAPVQFTSENPVETLLKSNSNGTNYGGKPKGDHYRFNPDFLCENKPSPVASIKVQESDFVLVENKKMVCSNSTTTLPLNLLDASIYQTEIVGYQEGIFEGKSEIPNSIPANLVEVWCRDRNDEQGIETISYYDRVKKEAVTRVYYSTYENRNYIAHLIPDFSVARVIVGSKIQLGAGRSFDLEVDRDQPSVLPGLFKGKLNIVLNEKAESRDMNCRLGGSLDPNIWPIAKFTDFNLNNVVISGDKTSLVFNTPNAPNQNSLYLVSFANAAPPKLIADYIEQNGMANYSDYSFSGDDANIYFNSKYILAQFNITSGLKRTLSNVNTGSMQNIIGGFKTTSDNNNILYRQHIPGSPRNQVELKIQNLSTGATRVLNPPLVGTDSGISRQFELIADSSQAVFLCCSNPYNDLYVADLGVNGSYRKLTPSVLTPDWYVESASKIPNNSKFIMATVRGKGAMTSSYRGFVVWLDGSSTYEVPYFGGSSFIYTEKTNLYLAFPTQTNLKSDSLDILDAKTGLKTDVVTNLSLMTELYTNPSVFFSKQSQLIAPQKISSGKQRALSYDPQTKISKDLCPGVTADLVFIKEMTLPGEFIVGAVDKEIRQISIYRSSASSICQKVNSILIQKDSISYIQDIAISEDQNAIALNLNTTRFQYLGYGQLFYIPLNGRAGFRVNSPAFLGAQVTNFFFTKDSNAIIYYGPQVQTGTAHLYRWEIPLQ